MAPARQPARLGHFKLGFARLGVYSTKWEHAFDAISKSVTWQVANINVARDSTTGQREPDYSLTHDIRGVFEERGGTLLPLPPGFVQKGEAVFRCFDNVQETDRILLPENGNLYQVGYVQDMYENLRGQGTSSNATSFKYRIMDLHHIALLSFGAPSSGTTMDPEMFLYPNLFGDYNLCVMASEYLYPQPLAPYNLCVLADEFLTATTLAPYNLCVLADEELVVSPTTTYSLGVA